MKAWQLTLGLAVLAVAAGQLPEVVVADDAPPLRARLDRVVGDADYGLVGPEERPPLFGTTMVAPARTKREIEECFGVREDWTRPVPDIVVRYHVLPEGSTDSALIQEPASLRLGSPYTRCVGDAVSAARFAPFGGDSVWLDYSFDF